jgi:hypothetical protein
MTARRIVLVVIAAVLVAVAAVGAVVLVLLNSGPHYLKASDLLARPEGKLVYPGSQVLTLDRHDETQPGFEAPSEASVIRTLATTDPIDAVIAWYDVRLRALGYSRLPGNADDSAFWRHGSSYFDLVYGRAVVVRNPPPGAHVFTTSFSVQAGTS